MVDWNKPIEAVEKSSGRVVPMTYMGNNRFDESVCRYTERAPDGATSNNCWSEDGTDRCWRNAWFIRNVVDTSEYRVRVQTRDADDWRDVNASTRKFSSKADALAFIAENISDDVGETDSYRYVLETRPASVWTPVDFSVKVTIE